MKISEYADAVAADLQDFFKGWAIYTRPDGSPRNIGRDPWGIEVWVPSFEAAGVISAPKATVLCEAKVTYAYKAVTHSQFHQAQDIALAVMAYLIEKFPPSFVVDTEILIDRANGPADLVREEQRSEQIQNIRVGTFLAGAGLFEVIVSWQDVIDITRSIDIVGYEQIAPPTEEREPTRNLPGPVLDPDAPGPRADDVDFILDAVLDS